MVRVLSAALSPLGSCCKASWVLLHHLLGYCCSVCCFVGCSVRCSVGTYRLLERLGLKYSSSVGSSRELAVVRVPRVWPRRRLSV